MKRLWFLLIVGMLTLMIANCGGGPKIDDEIAVDTTPVAVEDTTPPPPPPPPPPAPKIDESQFQTAYFDFDKFALRSDAKASLDANYQLLTEFPDAIIKVEGHCDERGTVEYNISLGEKRARSVQEYLVGLGINPNRVSIISYGKERPADPGSNEAAWDKNRRCEFKVISQ